MLGGSFLRPSADERREAIAEREDAPRRGGDVEARPEGEHQQQHRDRIEQDAERETARVIGRPVEVAAADARQQQQAMAALRTELETAVADGGANLEAQTRTGRDEIRQLHETIISLRAELEKKHVR